MNKANNKTEKKSKKALVMQNIYVRNVLEDINLEINDGEFVIILGENGAGKTTLFNTISGSIKPARGSIFINENDVTKQNMCERSALIANVFQDPKVGTVASMSIRDNLCMAYMRGRKYRIIAGRADCLFSVAALSLPSLLSSSLSEQLDEVFRKELTKIGLEDRLDNLCGELSGGQRQALSIVMALLSDSKIILLDEITAALDSVNSEKVLNIIKERVIETHKTCLMITHNMDHLRRFDRVKLLRLERRKIILN